MKLDWNACFKYSLKYHLKTTDIMDPVFEYCKLNVSKDIIVKLYKND